MTGSSSDKAAASCYEVKQVNPSASSRHLAVHPADERPGAVLLAIRETDGGGWVMIGRGREGWTRVFTTAPATRINCTRTPLALPLFTPVQLPANTVDALLNGIKPQDLPDGMRLHRAHNARGNPVAERLCSASLRLSSGPWAMSYGQR